MDLNAYFLLLNHCISRQTDLAARITYFDQTLDSLELTVVEQTLDTFQEQFQSLRNTYPRLDQIDSVLLQHNPSPEGKTVRQGFQILEQKNTEIQRALEEIDDLVDTLFNDQDDD